MLIKNRSTENIQTGNTKGNPASPSYVYQTEDNLGKKRKHQEEDGVQKHSKKMRPRRGRSRGRRSRHTSSSSASSSSSSASSSSASSSSSSASSNGSSASNSSSNTSSSSSSCDAADELDSLVHESGKLAEIYAFLQKQCSYRLSKISLFIMRIGDCRSLYDSGCKWIRKESLARQLETESPTQTGTGGSLEHNDTMTNIERTVADVLRKRMLWLREFVKQVESRFCLLEGLYDEISEFAVAQLDENDQDLASLYKSYYVEKSKYPSLLSPPVHLPPTSALSSPTPTSPARDPSPSSSPLHTDLVSPPSSPPSKKRPRIHEVDESSEDDIMASKKWKGEPTSPIDLVSDDDSPPPSPPAPTPTPPCPTTAPPLVSSNCSSSPPSIPPLSPIPPINHIPIPPLPTIPQTTLASTSPTSSTLPQPPTSPPPPTHLPHLTSLDSSSSTTSHPSPITCPYCHLPFPGISLFLLHRLSCPTASRGSTPTEPPSTISSPPTNTSTTTGSPRPTDPSTNRHLPPIRPTTSPHHRSSTTRATPSTQRPQPPSPSIASSSSSFAPNPSTSEVTHEHCSPPTATTKGNPRPLPPKCHQLPTSSSSSSSHSSAPHPTSLSPTTPRHRPPAWIPAAPPPRHPLSPSSASPPSPPSSPPATTTYRTALLTQTTAQRPLTTLPPTTPSTSSPPPSPPILIPTADTDDTPTDFDDAPAAVRDPNRCYCCQTVCKMANRKNFMGHINRMHRDWPSSRITSTMGQSFAIFDCHCGYHCLGKRGLAQHASTCSHPRPDTWLFPPHSAETNAAEDNTPPASPDDDVDIPDSRDYEDLMARFRTPAHIIHHTWKDPCRTIVEDLLEKAVSTYEDTASRNIAALNLLPGLLSVHSSRKKGDGLLSPINWLRTILAQPDFSIEIVRFARVAAAKPRRATPPLPWKPTTIETLRARTTKLVANGRLRSACMTIDMMSKILEGEALRQPLSGEALAQRIAELHPASNHLDVLPPLEDDPLGPCLQITPEQLRERVYSLKFDSASGNTGWTNSLIYALCNDRSTPGFTAGMSPPLPIIDGFCNLGNKMLRGEIRGVGRDLLVGARLTLIDKPDGGSRPIRIECACRRWFSTTACALAMLTIGPKLRPLQLGGGLSHGAGIGARRGGEYFDREGFSVLSVDIENAFNSTRHRVIYDALLEYFPSLIRFFRFKYGSPSAMRNNLGVIVALTRTGVGQGDPWGSLFFEVAIQATLLRTQDALRSIEQDSQLVSPNLLLGRKGTVLAFEDDTSVMGDTRVIFELAPLLEDIFSKDGFVVKVSKSTITGRDVERMADEIPEPAGFLLSTEGTTMLGVAIGSRDFRQSIAQTKLKKMLPTPQALLLMGPRIATSLLLQCYNLRPLFLMASATDPDDVVTYARTHDGLTTSAIASILRTPTTYALEQRCFLPPHLGGIGLIRHAGMSTEKSQITQRLAYTEFIAKYYPTEFDNITEQNQPVNIQLGKYENLEDTTGLTPAAMEGLTLRSCHGILGTAKRTAESALSRILQDSLQSDSLSRAAWMLSCSASATSFIKSARGIQNDRMISPEQFRCALRCKLGGSPTELENIPDALFECQCGTVYCPAEDPYHGANCRMNAFYRTHRHNDIMTTLRDYTKRALGLGNEAIQMEAYAGLTEATDLSGPKRVTADISVVTGGEKLWVDVSIVDPGSSVYINRHHSHSTLDAASKAMESHKRLHYQAVRHPLPLPPSSIIPFVLEASGRLGPAALGFVGRIGGSHTFLRSQFLNDISLTSATYLGKMLQATREWMAANPKNWRPA